MPTFMPCLSESEGRTNGFINNMQTDYRRQIWWEKTDVDVCFGVYFVVSNFIFLEVDREHTVECLYFICTKSCILKK